MFIIRFIYSVIKKFQINLLLLLKLQFHDVRQIAAISMIIYFTNLNGDIKIGTKYNIIAN